MFFENDTIKGETAVSFGCKYCDYKAKKEKGKGTLKGNVVGNLFSSTRSDYLNNFKYLGTL